MDVRQVEMRFATHGGAREGAGRKRTVHSRVPHRSRDDHARAHPLHVTLKLVAGVPSLRERGAHHVVRNAIHAAADCFGFRVVHFSAQSNHLHLICEAEDRDAITRGMKGLAVRLVRGLNKLWGRTGRLLADRFHARALETPREVRNALRYVFHNARGHGARFAGVLDPCSSACAFDGWSEHGPLVRNLLARARTWLLTTGWRRHGLLSVLRA